MLTSENKLQVENQVIQIERTISVFAEVERYFTNEHLDLASNSEHILHLIEVGEMLLQSIHNSLVKYSKSS